jgi:hypothetical protein
MAREEDELATAQQGINNQSLQEKKCFLFLA